MCNKTIGCLKEQASLESESVIDRHNQQQQHETVHLMDSPTAFVNSGSNPSSNDDNPKVKFLCSFLGSILPRPQDGKLRYVGGETRIVSVPRDISYEELMGKMRELFEGVTVLKYQQPDEDLDALVSVVNDDDVTNMMEEYDKLGAGDGFTRLRIFLFSHPDQDGSLHYSDADDRDNERRYVDALNSLNESPDFRKHQPSEYHVLSPVDEVHVAEQHFNNLIEGGVHNSQRNREMHLPPMNLRRLNIPHMGSGQHQQPASQRYNEVEVPWSPVYQSPRHPDPRQVAEFPTSPSFSHYHAPYGEFSDRTLDRIPEDYSTQQVNHPYLYDHQPSFAENKVLFPGESPAGFPGNILHGPNAYDGNAGFEQRRMTFTRNQAYPDSPWKHGEQTNLEPPKMGNGFHQVANHCAECHPNREILMLNTDGNMHHQFYPRDQTDPQSLYSDIQSHERGWVLQNASVEEPRSHVAGTGRLADHCIIDGNGIGVSLGHGALSDGHPVHSHYVHHEDPRCIRAGSELGNQVFHEQTVATGSHVHIPLEERGVRYGNMPYTYGTDNVYQASPGHMPAHALWRNAHNVGHGASSYEASGTPQLVSVNSGFMRPTLEGSPRLRVGLEPQQKVAGFDLSPLTVRLMPRTYSQENLHLLGPDPAQFQHDIRHLATPTDCVTSASILAENKLVPLTTTIASSRTCMNDAEINIVEDDHVHQGKQMSSIGNAGDSIMPCVSGPEDRNPDCVVSRSACPDSFQPARQSSVLGPDESAPMENEELSANHFSFLPELIASVKKAALECTDEVKGEAQENYDRTIIKHDTTEEEETHNESVAHGDLDLDSDNEDITKAKIEPTNAEKEAIERGLQTVKNDDLEEIRELGSGTYGAVYHGKWKGSDVAIKRIKASCFAGRPSERERLIADFWKEALILSSLHHPNVVSFYGVVRDGPDGCLATVTEFMVNGSLKQFLQKKDRTIDRRKRLIIAMDVAFGMEYLHGKSIVHFDLKCENLLVNMRDPHRPVCKIGDLGLSKVKQHTLVSGGVRGTLPWMAPELLSGKSTMVTEKIDVYSFGIVMWELLTGDEPYKDMHCASLIGGIVNNTLRPQIPTWCDPEWKLLMESCWAFDPSERPSFSKISQRLRNMAAAMNLK